MTKYRNNLMPYIKDKDVYKAVMFARKMHKDGMNAGLAIYKASRYYKVDQSDVAYYMGQLGGNVNAIRNGK